MQSREHRAKLVCLDAHLSLAASQVVERLAKASEKRDLLVLNFGLHFSEAYEEELKLLVQQVKTRHAPPVHPAESIATPCAPQRLLVRAGEDAQFGRLETSQPLEQDGHSAGATAEEGRGLPLFAVEGHSPSAL